MVAGAEKISGRQTYLLRAHEVPGIVESQGLGLTDEIKKNIILWHLIVDKIMETVLQQELSKHDESHSRPTRKSLSVIEENALCYAAGYIMRKVLTKYRKRSIHSDCIDGLTSLLLDEIGDNVEKESYLDYTRIWLEKTNRGGLYHVSSLCYDLFYEIEMSVYEKLQDQFTSKIKSTIEDIERIAYNDADVNRIWANCSVSMPINSGEILRDIIHEWVHLRGHSLTSEYMEQYKRLKQQETRKKKGIRGELKKKSYGCCH